MKGGVLPISSGISYSYNWIAESPIRAVADDRYEKMFLQDSIQELKRNRAVFCLTQHMVDILKKACDKKGLKYTVSYFDECWVFIRRS